MVIAGLGLRRWGLGALATLLALGPIACPSYAQEISRDRADARVQRPVWANDLTGYWVSLITEDWRLRMLTPAKGDYVGIPLTAAAARVADAWNPARDAAGGQQCRSYGAAAIMFRPEELRIGWEDNEATLSVSVDAGMQTRLLHFGGTVPVSFQPTWQGYSSATWVARTTPGFVQSPPEAQYLHVITTHMLPGYLRQNGIPYSAQAVLTEDFDLVSVQGEQPYLTDTTTVADPLYLEYPLVLSPIFEKQPGAAGWDPAPCSSTW